MKLFIFIIIIGIIYLLATKIKVVHIDSLPSSQQKELNERTRLRNMLLTTYVRCPEKELKSLNNNNKETNIKKKIRINLLDLIRQKLVDKNYNFNFINLPIVQRYVGKNISQQDKLYRMHINKDIISWNNKLFGPDKNKIKFSGIILNSIIETNKEFIIDANVIVLHEGKENFLKLKYYGIIQKSDDPFFGGENEYYLQLVDIKEISEEDYNTTNILYDNAGPFVTMAEQMAYVDKINKMHENEMNAL